MDNNAGIIILALQHNLYYGYARNLVATIRAYDTITPITVVVDDLTKGTFEAWLNVDVKLIDSDIIWHNSQIQSFRAKLHLPELSPYKKTLYIDADMAWMQKPAHELLKQLDGIPFTMSNGGRGEKCIWANAQAIRKEYGDGDIYHLFSECIYFEKSKEVAKLFKTALAAFDKPKVNTIPFAGGKASDEFAFITGMMNTGIYPHKEDWLPIFWYHTHKKRMATHPQYLTDFWGYSLGGNQAPEFVKRNYNILVRAAYDKIGLQNPYSAHDKRKVIAERKNI